MADKRKKECFFFCLSKSYAQANKNASFIFHLSVLVQSTIANDDIILLLKKKKKSLPSFFLVSWRRRRQSPTYTFNVQSCNPHLTNTSLYAHTQTHKNSLRKAMTSSHSFIILLSCLRYWIFTSYIADNIVWISLKCTFILFYQ